jgi:YjbE family integral membrane protein
MNYHILLAAGGIALINIILSGDNALVIGAAASRLRRSQRLFAIIWGGAAAVVIRLLLSAVATELLQIPLLQLIGGIIIFVLAVRLLLPEGKAGQSPRRVHEQLLPAIITILVADVTMSLDNVLAVAAMAAGNIPLLTIGLVSSMVLLFVASAFIARLMETFSWLIDLAAVVLAWTAANLILADPKFIQLVQISPNGQQAIHFGFVALTLLIDLFIRAILTHSRHAAAGAVKEQEPATVTLPPLNRDTE